MAPGVAASPCRYALRVARAIPARELGPLLRKAFLRFAAICRSVAIAWLSSDVRAGPSSPDPISDRTGAPTSRPIRRDIAQSIAGLSPPCLQQSEHFASCDKISRRALDGFAFVEPELSQQFQDLSSGCIRSGPALSGPSNQIYAWKKHCWITQRGRSKTTAAMARPSTSANSEAAHQDRSASHRPRFLGEEVRKLATTAAAKGCVMKQRTAALPSWKPVLLTRGSTQTHSLLKSPTEFSVSRSKLASKNVRKKNFPGFEFRRHA
ncbi:hypothetical protein ABIF57_000620 [Bradyrhizobium diazoefficiens]